MKTLEQFEEYYHSTLRPELAALEIRRKSLSMNLTVGGLAFLCVTVGIIILGSRKLALQPGGFVFFIIISVIVFGILCHLITKNYKTDFKKKIIGSIVRFIDNNLTYNPSECIPKETFIRSSIFTTKPNRYDGEDFVHGKIGATEITFSEVHAEYESGSGKNRTRRTIFRGLFFVGDFNKDFHGQTVVLPDTAEKLFGNFGKVLQSWNMSRGELIRLEDPEFESYFAVYGDNQIEARYILSTSLMQRIVEFRKKADRKIYLSFTGSRIYAAIEYTKNLFEPPIFRTALDFQPVREYFEDLSLAAGIAEDLDLNTRIWSKE